MSRACSRGRRHPGALAALVLAAALLGGLAAPGAARADKSPVIVDERWVAPDFAQRAPRRIAVLPAVTFDAFAAGHLVSDLFFDEFLNDGRTWVQPSLCRLLYGANNQERDSTLRVVSEQVRRSGRTDSLTTVALARRLRVDALVFLRVDRWEHTATPSEVTNVELHGELVDSTGATLLRLVSRSRLFGRPLRTAMDMSNPLASASETPASGTPTPASTPTRASADTRPADAAAQASGTGGHASPGAAHLATQVSEADVPYAPAVTALLRVWRTILPTASAARTGGASGGTSPTH